jgi:hypothetical protein
MRATGGTLQLRRSNSSRRICQIRPITNPSPSAAEIWIIVTATRLIGLSPLADHPGAQWLINRFGSNRNLKFVRLLPRNPHIGRLPGRKLWPRPLPDQKLSGGKWDRRPGPFFLPHHRRDAYPHFLNAAWSPSSSRPLDTFARVSRGLARTSPSVLEYRVW